MATVSHLEFVEAVLIIVQNLVVIDAVVLIIWKFKYLARLAGKRPFMPQK